MRTDVIMGQSTVAQEIYEDLDSEGIQPSMMVNTVGGGGLISGVGLYSKFVSPECQIFGVEPKGANSLYISMANQGLTSVQDLDTFVDGASVRTMGQKNYEICVENNIVDEVVCVDNEVLCDLHRILAVHGTFRKYAVICWICTRTKGTYWSQQGMLRGIRYCLHLQSVLGSV